MDRFFFSIVRCVPNPRTGEFINVGAVAGSPELGQWSVRQIGNESRLRRLADRSDIAVFHDFIDQLGFEIDQNSDLVEGGEGEPLDEKWLTRIHYDNRSVVQLSSPTPIFAENAESALQTIFDNYIIDEAQQSRNYLTKQRAVSELWSAYKRAEIEQQYVQRRVDLIVGDHLATRLDFAIANGRTLQLSQGWSFQVGGVDDIGLQVKSWAYTLGRLRAGVEGRIFDTRPDSTKSTIVPDNVDLEALVIPPITQKQERVFREATQVFADLDVKVRNISEVDRISEAAAELVRYGTTRN